MRRMGWTAGWVLVFAALTGARAGELEFDATVRLRLEGRTNRDFDRRTGDGRAQLLQRTRVGVRYRPDPQWDLRFMLQDSRNWDHSHPPADEAELEVQEAWGSYAGLADGKLKLTVGRQPLSYGNQRLLGAFEWSNVARRFDALKVTWNAGPAVLDGFVAELGSSPGTTTVNGELWGLYSVWPKLWGARGEAYGLWLHDPSSATTNIVTLGGRRSASVGPWTYDLEGAVQVGDVTAFAAALEGGRRLGSFEVRGGYNVASGDSSPGVGGSHTFANLFPTNHLYYGYLDYQSWRNLHNLHARVRVPTRGYVRAEAVYNAFWLFDSRDFWYGAAGAPMRGSFGPFRDPAGAAGTQVGQELDVVISIGSGPRGGFEFGYGHFWPGGFIREVNRRAGVVTRGSDFVYLQGIALF